jgi:hypothetical protein
MNCSPAANAGNSVQLSVLENQSIAGIPKFVNITGNISLNGQPSLNVSRIDVLGEINGSIVAQRVGTGPGGIRAVGSIKGDITTVAKAGSPFTTFPVTLVESTSGNVLGDITAEGRIDAVLARSGTIGTAGAKISLTSNLAPSGDLIGLIEAKSIYADITTSSFVTRVKTTGLGANEGDFVGSINARRIAGGADPGVYGLDIARDLKAKIILTGSLATDTNDEFIIGGSFPDGGYVNGESNYRITLPPGRFTRQMIVNRSNNATNTWSGQVKVGSTLLSDQPYYSNTSALLGNQAIGLMPFMVHYNECEPTGLGTPGVALTGCNYHATGYTRTSITIEHYGQVGYRNSANNAWQSTPPAGTQGIIVERKRVDDCNANWTDISSSFSVAVDANNARSIIITGPFASAPLNEPTWLYRIRPMRATASGQAPLRCREPLDSPSAPIVGDYTYVYLADGVEDIPGGGQN